MTPDEHPVNVWLDLLRELGAVCIVAVLVCFALFLVMTIGAVIVDLFADERASARLDRIIREELAPAEVPTQAKS